MKKIFLVLLLLGQFISSTAQTCAEREEKLLGMAGAFSAGYLLNTYSVIGSIADGFAKDAYSSSTVVDIMNQQKQLADNITDVIQKMISGKFFKDEADVTYMKECLQLIKGLKAQAQYLREYAETSKEEKREAYSTQRNKNWKGISKLMGIEEEE
jgi:hypothetical protein